MGKRIKWVISYCAIILSVLLIAYGSSAAVSTIAQNDPIDRNHCIIIDAGHGGVDGGAVSCTGKAESIYNLEIAQRLNDLISFLGYETKMIRNTDMSVYTEGETISQKKISDLKERLRIVNQTDQAILVSIHQNYFPDSRYRGPQVFYAKAGSGEELGRKLQESLVANLKPQSNRKAKQAQGIYLMDRINCTGILVECGFLSNVQETLLLQNPDYQKSLCAVIASCISTFLSNT